MTHLFNSSISTAPLECILHLKTNNVLPLISFPWGKKAPLINNSIFTLFSLISASITLLSFYWLSIVNQNVTIGALLFPPRQGGPHHVQSGCDIILTVGDKASEPMIIGFKARQVFRMNRCEKHHATCNLGDNKQKLTVEALVLHFLEEGLPNFLH